MDKGARSPIAVLPDADERLPVGKNELIQSKFLLQSQELPAAIALVHDNTNWTYAEVELHSRVLAFRLREHGLTVGSRIAVLAERCPALVWTMLAVLRIGGVFIVLDSEYPAPRLQQLLDLCSPRAMLLAGGDRLSDIAGRLVKSRDLPLIRDEPPFEAPTDYPLDQAPPVDPAYFLFTSGTMGTPRCVACNHIPLAHFIAWHATTFGLDRNDRFSMLSGLSHDPLLRDIFTPLSIGAAVVIPQQSTIITPGALRPWLRDARVTAIHLTPALGQLIVAGGARGPALPDVRNLFWGGDQLLPRLVADVNRLAPDAAHTNFYGCTETPQAAAYFRYGGDPLDGPVPIGKGTDGFQIFVVDADRRPVGPGIVGEIAVRSNFLSVGYVGNGTVSPATDRGVDGQGRSSIYYTGDRGRYLPTGDVVMLGRADDQIKIRGYRIDLSEVTSSVQAHPLVRSAIALPIVDGPRIRIDAFAAVDHPAQSNQAEIGNFLSARLPAYMLPSRVWVFERHLPLLPNGKVNREALLTHAKSTKPSVENRTHSAAEAALIEKWAGIFGAHEVSTESSFTSLGGDSLSYVQAYLATEDVVGIVPAGWPDKSIAELAKAEVVRSRLWSVVDSAVVVRALSITLIVAFHLGLSNIGDGFTAALFIVSGFLFGRIQLHEIFHVQSARSILRSIRHLLIPTFCYIAALFVWDIRRGLNPPLDALILATDLHDYSGATTNLSDLLLWYIDALVQILLFLYVALTAAMVLPERYRQPSHVALSLFALGCLGRFVLPGFYQPDFFVHGIPAMSLFQIAPTTHLASFMLGVLLAEVQSGSSKFWQALFVAAYAASSAVLFGLIDGVAAGAAGGLLLVMTRVTLPRPIAMLVFRLSGASLFIYLTHVLFGRFVRALLGMDWSAVEVLVALTGGVGVHAGWNWAAIRLKRLAQAVAPARQGHDEPKLLPDGVTRGRAPSR